MCVYCNMGDHAFRFNPPWRVTPQEQQQFPTIPQPFYPNQIGWTWGIQQLREYYELLKGVRDLEAQVGCPCEPNKADYIKLFEDRIAKLEREAAGKGAR